MPPLRILIEAGQKRVFACALDYTGLARLGKTEESAIEAVLAALPRYQAVAHEAGLPFDPVAAGSKFEVVERVEGNATTDFGAPGIVGEGDREPLTTGGVARAGPRLGDRGLQQAGVSPDGPARRRLSRAPPRAPPGRRTAPR